MNGIHKDRGICSECLMSDGAHKLSCSRAPAPSSKNRTRRFKPLVNGGHIHSMQEVGNPNGSGGWNAEYVLASDYDELSRVREHALVNASEFARLEQRITDLNAQLTACNPWLKDNETPAQRLESNHKEGLALLGLLAAEKRKVEALEELLGKRVDKLKELGHETKPHEFVLSAEPMGANAETYRIKAEDLDALCAELRRLRKQAQKATVPHQRVWTGPGHLEETGYIDPTPENGRPQS